MKCCVVTNFGPFWNETIFGYCSSVKKVLDTDSDISAPSLPHDLKWLKTGRRLCVKTFAPYVTRDFVAVNSEDPLRVEPKSYYDFFESIGKHFLYMDLTETIVQHSKKYQTGSIQCRNHNRKQKSFVVIGSKWMKSAVDEKVKSHRWVHEERSTNTFKSHVISYYTRRTEVWKIIVSPSSWSLVWSRGQPVLSHYRLFEFILNPLLKNLYDFGLVSGTKCSLAFMLPILTDFDPLFRGEWR